MKTGYCLIDSPFKYHLCYLNSSLNYKTPSCKPFGIYGNVVRQTSKKKQEIKTTVPVDDGGAGKASFDFALEVANVFDNTITNNTQYNFTNKTLIVYYQNHVLNDANYSTFWDYALNKNKDLKNEDRMYQPGAFHKICTSFFNNVASSGCPIAAGDCLLR